jgi:hypothetical protein
MQEAPTIASLGLFLFDFSPHIDHRGIKVNLES